MMSFFPRDYSGSMSNAFAALIWWVVPLTAVICALGYVIWVTKFQAKFENETTRSMGQFQRFQSTLRNRAELDAKAAIEKEKTEPSA